MEEIWKDVIGYEGSYQISNLGNVKSLLTNKNLKPCINGSGYYIVSLCKKGKKKSTHIHSLLAEHFLIKKSNDLVVDHINNIKTDNSLENLQYTTYRVNNTKDKINKKSKYIGLTFDKKCNKWRARIRINKINISLGYYETEYEAHLAYEKALKNSL